MVDVDPAELREDGDSVTRPGLRRRRRLPPGDARAGATRSSPSDRRDWRQRCADWKTRYPVVPPEHRKPDGRVSIYHLSRESSADALPTRADVLVSGSSGSGIEIFLLAFDVNAGSGSSTPPASARWGTASPRASARASLAAASRTVCVDGDGGFQFNIQELETVARLQLPIKFFVLNNDGYASIRASQTTFFGQPRIGCDDSTGQSLPNLATWHRPTAWRPT